MDDSSLRLLLKRRDLDVRWFDSRTTLILPAGQGSMFIPRIVPLDPLLRARLLSWGAQEHADPSDRFACGGECRNLMTDSNNCGGCNVTCTITEICQQGHCMVKCADSQTSCPDGCHDLQYDRLNCGNCGNACPTGLVCNRSLCSPPLATTIQTYAG